MGKALDAALESFPDASAGGHARMGGGQVPLPDGGNVEQLTTVGGDTPEDLEDRLFAAMNGEA